MWPDNDVPSLNVDSVLHEEMENKDVLLNSYEFLVEDDQTSDARIWSDIDTNNTPQFMTDKVARACIFALVSALFRQPNSTLSWVRE